MLIHLFIDWENTIPTGADLELVRGPEYRLWIVHGPHQKSFMAEQVSALQPLGAQVRFVQGTKSGHNAMDLHVAFYMGEASEQDRNKVVQACYVIVSGDKDFDPLLVHLIGKEVKAGRAESIPKALQVARALAEGIEAKLPPKPQPKSQPGPQPKPQSQLKPQPKPQPRPSMSEHANRVIEDLRAHPKNRPRTTKRLHNHIGSLLGKENSPGEVERVVAELKALKAITVDGMKVGYDLKNK